MSPETFKLNFSSRCSAQVLHSGAHYSVTKGPTALHSTEWELPFFHHTSCANPPPTLNLATAY